MNICLVNVYRLPLFGGDEHSIDFADGQFPNPI